MSTKRLLLLLGSIGLLVAGGIAWSNYYPASDMIGAAGLPGRTASGAGRQCQHWYRNSSLGPVPVRRVTCYGPYRSGPAQLRHDERVGYDPVTRRVTHVHREWEADDSLAWVQAQDSVAAALERRGGRLVSCGQVSPVLEHIRSRLIWRFSGYDVRLTAYRGIPGQSVLRWILQVDAFPGGAPECGGPAVRRA